MNHKIKATLLVLLLLVTVICVTGCAKDLTPYEINDAEGYNVSVKYDANGGFFTTNTAVIVDSYNLADLKGQNQIALIAPEDARRGNDAFAAINSGYFMAGWYTERVDNGDGTYTYAGKWNFEEDLLTVDNAAANTSSEPVLTLYAAWVPLFQIEFCDLESGEVLGSYTFDPGATDEILVPAWDEGEWYHIYTVEQFLDNASINGSYVIHADLDFADEIWPTSLMYGNFTGTIQGNGHTFKNISLEQTNNSKVNAGLFGRLAEGSAITDLTLENVTFTIKAGTRVAGTTYGLFAGAISNETVIENVAITSGTLQIDSRCYFGVDDYAIGLLCGMGSADIDTSGIICQGSGDNAESVVITVVDDVVTVEFVTE